MRLQCFSSSSSSYSFFGDVSPPPCSALILDQFLPCCVVRVDTLVHSSKRSPCRPRLGMDGMGGPGIVGSLHTPFLNQDPSTVPSRLFDSPSDRPPNRSLPGERA
jgi:hypothetical protein